MVTKFVVGAYPSRSEDGLSKQEIIEKYRNWVDHTPNTTQKDIEIDLTNLTFLCRLDRYSYTFIDIEHNAKAPSKININDRFFSVRFVSKAKEG
jgi:hypothetical protein